MESIPPACTRPSAHAARFLAVLVLSSVVGASNEARAADEVVADCSSDSELRADLTAMQESDGGTLTFSCPESTIVLTADLPLFSKPTTIDGDGKITISGNNARRIFTTDATGIALKHLALTGGSSTGNGGTIYSDGGVFLEEVTIEDSVAALAGGAIYCSAAVLDRVLVRNSVAALAGGAVNAEAAVVQDSELASNKASSGGAIFVRGSLVLEKSWVHDNEATGTDDGWGGALYLSDSSSLEDNVLSGNVAAKCGAGVFLEAENASVVMTRMRIVDNVCKSGDGAGIHFVGKALVVDESEVSFNETPGSGGGLSCGGESLIVSSSTFEGNASGGSGGAISVTDSTAVLDNATLSSNQAATAGALRAEGSTVVVDYLTIASNKGSGSGAFHCSVDGERTVVLRGTLLADNEEPNLALAGSGGAQIVSQGGNVSDDDSASATLTQATDLRSATTLLGPLGLHGGLTPTHIPQLGSDAIDMGITSVSEGKDQRGFERFQGLSMDAGAVEVFPCEDETILCGDANDNGTVTSGDALRALRTAVGTDTCALSVCDYDGNGKVRSSDALAILRKSVGQPTSPSCPDCYPTEVEPPAV